MITLIQSRDFTHENCGFGKKNWLSATTCFQEDLSWNLDSSDKLCYTPVNAVGHLVRANIISVSNGCKDQAICQQLTSLYFLLLQLPYCGS